LLSKLRYNNSLSDDEIRYSREGISPHRLLASINWHNFVVEKVEHGTLSASFIVTAGEYSAFLKTHLTSQDCASLEREALLLGCLYKETLSNYVQILSEPDDGRIWLMMPVFDKNIIPIEPIEVIEMIEGLSLDKIYKSNSSIIENNFDDIRVLINYGKMAYENLSILNMLDQESRVTANDALNLLDLQISSLQLVICHGDLSPPNIMRYKQEPILIDWEDAFLGVADYDYLFWLTFFENRKFYKNSPLKNISIDREIARALLVLIVLIKCELAWRGKSWMRNTLKFNDRIAEISRLD
jgi:hypothetical protein